MRTHCLKATCQYNCIAEGVRVLDVPKLVDHQQRRDEIVRAVWELIAAEGLSAVTLRNIAAHGRFSMGRVQHYFKDRDALLVGSLSAMVDASGRTLQSLPDDPRQALRTLLTHPILASETSRLDLKVWHTYLAEGITHYIVGAAVRKILADNEDFVTDALNGNRDTARMLLAASDGLTYRVLVANMEPDDAVTILDHMIDQAVRFCDNTHQQKSPLTNTQLSAVTNMTALSATPPSTARAASMR